MYAAEYSLPFVLSIGGCAIQVTVTFALLTPRFTLFLPEQSEYET